MTITLHSRDNTYIISIDDRQVVPNTESGADDTLVAIDLNSLPGWDDTYIQNIKVEDDGTQMGGGQCGYWYGDISMELDAVAVRHSTIIELASIGDYVWDDTDKDGIQDVGELGIDNVAVEIYEVGETVPLQTTQTDATGYYAFTNLFAGDYVVKFIKPATRIFSPQNAGGAAPDSDADQTTGETGTITVVPGENNTTVDAGMYQEPTLVVLTHFGAIERGGDVVVQWSTAEEVGTIGFFVERQAADESWVSVNADLVHGALFSTGPQDYEVVDAGAAPGATYVYRLVEIENTGKRNVYGPFTVDVPGEVVESREPVPAAPAAPAITAMQAVSGSIVLRWASESGRTYAINRTAEPGGTPVTVATGVPATPPENTVILVDGADAGFYSIQVED